MACIIRVPSRCRQATKSSSLVPRYAYTMGLEMPASSAISSMLAAWKPRREKTLHGRVEHLLLADGAWQALEGGDGGHLASIPTRA